MPGPEKCLKFPPPYPYFPFFVAGMDLHDLPAPLHPGREIRATFREESALPRHISQTNFADQIHIHNLYHETIHQCNPFVFLVYNERIGAVR
jgi:hypothetical protein